MRIFLSLCECKPRYICKSFIKLTKLPTLFEELVDQIQNQINELHIVDHCGKFSNFKTKELSSPNGKDFPKVNK